MEYQLKLKELRKADWHCDTKGVRRLSPLRKARRYASWEQRRGWCSARRRFHAVRSIEMYADRSYAAFQAR